MRGLLLIGALLIATQARAAGDCAPVVDSAISAFTLKSPNALELFDKALQRGCTDERTYLHKGLLLRGAQKLADAVATFQTGLDRHPQSCPLALEHAMTLAWMGRLNESLARYEILHGRHPDDLRVQLGRALLLSWLGHAEQSLSGYREILAHEPNNLDALRGMAAAYRNELRIGRARALYGEVLRRSPGDKEAQAGLAALSQLTRFELHALLGFAGSSTSGLGPVGALRGSLHLTPRLTLGLGYRQEAALVPGDRAAQLGWRHQAESGLLLQAGPRLHLGIAYQVTAYADTIRHALPIELSARLPRSFVLLGGARPGIDHAQRASVLAYAGLQYYFRPELWLMAQLFRYDDQAGEHATAAVGTFSVPILSRWTLKLGGVYGDYRQGHLFSGFAESWVQVSFRLSLSLTYQYVGGFFEQHAASAGARVRF